MQAQNAHLSAIFNCPTFPHFPPHFLHCRPVAKIGLEYAGWNQLAKLNKFCQCKDHRPGRDAASKASPPPGQRVKLEAGVMVNENYLLRMVQVKPRVTLMRRRVKMSAAMRCNHGDDFVCRRAAVGKGLHAATRSMLRQGRFASHTAIAKPHGVALRKLARSSPGGAM